MRLRRNSAPGADGITTGHLTHGSSPELLTILALLLTACFAHLDVPPSFSTSIIRPLINRPGIDPGDMDNYKPISLVSTFSKLLEMVILDEVESSTPHDLQFGFLPMRGTTGASSVY